MDLTRRLAGFGRQWHSRLRTLFEDEVDAAASPLDIAHAVLHDVERHVQPIGRGRRVFPWTRLLVHVQADEDGRASMEAAFVGFAPRVQERLAELRCECGPIDVDVVCEPERPPRWRAGQRFAVEYLKDADRTGAAAPSITAPPGLRLSVLKGRTADEAYRFSDPTVTIGRSADPADGLGRIRRNRVAFEDVVDGVTETVGRAHARIRFDANLQGYRLYDEGSRNGTAILRGGEVIPVPARDPRGVRLHSGDEIQLGRAVLRVDVEG